MANRGHSVAAWRQLALWLLVISGGALVGNGSARADDQLNGYWIDEHGEVILDIYPCANARCGRVAWLRLPLGPDRDWLKDYRNPDVKLRDRPVCGLEVLSGFVQQPDGKWGEGSVYVSDLGMTFSGQAEVLSPTQVQVRGYMLVSLFGHSEVWTKVAKPPELCWDVQKKPPPTTVAPAAQGPTNAQTAAPLQPEGQPKPDAPAHPLVTAPSTPAVRPDMRKEERATAPSTQEPGSARSAGEAGSNTPGKLPPDAREASSAAPAQPPAAVTHATPLGSATDGQKKLEGGVQAPLPAAKATDAPKTEAPKKAKVEQKDRKPSGPAKARPIMGPPKPPLAQRGSGAQVPPPLQPGVQPVPGAVPPAGEGAVPPAKESQSEPWAPVLKPSQL